MNDFLNRVPDIPRWVEARSLLLSGMGNVFGTGKDFLIHGKKLRLVCICGKPNSRLIREIVTVLPRNTIILGEPENFASLQDALTGWRYEAAIIHLLENDEMWISVPTDEIRLMRSAEEIPPETPTDLDWDLRQAFEWSPLAAAYENGKAVSFCYAGSITETLWDISIDTLENYRRRGLARKCVAFMIRLMKEQKKNPVWGSMESNLASIKLAQKLGFREVDRLAVFTQE